MRRLTVLLAALVPIALAIGSPPDIASELKALRDEYTKAQQDFFKEYQAAKTDAEKQKLFTDKYPAPKFKDRALDLAKRAKGDPAEFDVILFAYDFMRQNATDGGKECAAFIRDAADRFATHEKIGQLARLLDWPIPPAEARAITQTLLEKNRGTKAEPQLLYQLASSHKGWGQPSAEDEKRAKELLKEVVSKFPASSEAKSAKGDLFELDNLTVGKVFPDFKATDENGKAWRLRDYRGKVTVVDFWGFW